VAAAASSFFAACARAVSPPKTDVRVVVSSLFRFAALSLCRFVALSLFSTSMRH